MRVSAFGSADEELGLGGEVDLGSEDEELGVDGEIDLGNEVGLVGEFEEPTFSEVWLTGAGGKEMRALIRGSVGGAASDPGPQHFRQLNFISGCWYRLLFTRFCPLKNRNVSGRERWYIQSGRGFVLNVAPQKRCFSSQTSREAEQCLRSSVIGPRPFPPSHFR